MTQLPEGLIAAKKRELLKKLLAQRGAPEPAEYPLSYGQQALWFLHKLTPGMASYNVAITAAAKPPLDLRALEAALRSVIERHSSLRSLIADTPSGTVHRVLSDFSVPLTVAGRDALSREEIQADYARPFDLASELPFRASVYRASGADVLLLVAHHIAFDAWSAQLLFDDLTRAYGAALGNSAPPALPPPPSYARFVDWQRQLADSAQSESLREYWGRQLSGELPVLDIGTRRGGRSSNTGGSVPVEIDADVLAGLRQIGREQNATFFAIVLLSWAALLNRVTGCDEVMIGTPVSGRNKPEWTRTIGYFVNLLPMRVGLDPARSFRSQLPGTVNTVLQGLAHQDLPFPLMVDRLRIQRKSSSPVFQTMVNVQRVHPQSDLGRLFASSTEAVPLPFGSSHLTPFPIPQQEGQFDIGLELAEFAASASGHIKFSSDVLSPGRAETIAAQFMALLRAVVTDPDVPIDNLIAADTGREQFLI